jgi:penicillin-binding protein 2
MSSQSINKFEVPFWRILLVYILIVVVLGTLVYRLFSLQVVEGKTWADQSVDNYTTDISDPASRGIIYDRNRFILARNVASYNVVITPAGLPDDDADIQNIYRELSELVDVPVSEGDVEFAKLFSACVPGPGIAQIVELGDSIAPYKPMQYQ